MRTNYISIEKLAGFNYMPPLQKAVDEMNLRKLVDICNDGNEHAYIASLEPLGDSLRIVTFLTRSKEKWHQLREWVPTC